MEQLSGSAWLWFFQVWPPCTCREARGAAGCGPAAGLCKIGGQAKQLRPPTPALPGGLDVALYLQPAADFPADWGGSLGSVMAGPRVLFHVVRDTTLSQVSFSCEAANLHRPRICFRGQDSVPCVQGQHACHGGNEHPRTINRSLYSCWLFSPPRPHSFLSQALISSTSLAASAVLSSRFLLCGLQRVCRRRGLPSP